MPRLLLVRHAPTPETGSILTGRLPGVGLGPAGEAVAERAAEEFTGARVAAVISSPVQRCRETAGFIGNAVGHRPRTMKDFEEVDYGDWSGRKLRDLYRLKAWRHLHSAPSRVRFPNGETLAEARHRAVAGCEKLVSEFKPKDRVVVVSHSDIIKSIVGHYLGSPQDLLQRIAISPVSVSVIDLPTSGPPSVLAVHLKSGVKEWL